MVHYYNMEEPVVVVEQGKVKGKLGEHIRGGKFYSFQGIPYAEAPVGKLRFRAPQPRKPWKGIFDATEEGPQSIQKHYLTKQILGDEDCLNLNVYTPELPHENGNQLKPVMFFIHGGAFAQGSNKTEIYGPEFLMAEDVVLVVINYRLGILGFLSLEDPSLGVPGNAAFKDMVLSLKWVQKNIAQFGGDPRNVTIFGQSAGAAAAHFLMLSPMSQGLFHKVICQSGSVLSGWAYGKRVAKNLAKELGIPCDSEKKILEHLEEASPEDILEGQLRLDEQDIPANKARYIGLVIEKPSNEEPFMDKSPLEILASGQYQKLPIIMGYNSMEGLLFDIIVKGPNQNVYWEDPEINVPGLLNLEKGSPVSKVVGQKILKFYLGSGIISGETHKKQFYDLTTDNGFLRGIYSCIKRHVAQSSQPVFMYRMTVNTELNIYKRLTGMTLPGACHADDLGYLFKNIFTAEIDEGSIEDIVQRRFSKMWSNFAHYSHPTPKEDPLFEVVWKPVEKNKINYLEIGEKLVNYANPEPKRMAFWDDIYRVSPLTSKL